jgi:hypothetical protein
MSLFDKYSRVLSVQERKDRLKTAVGTSYFWKKVTVTVNGVGSNDEQSTPTEPRKMLVLGAISPIQALLIKLSNSNGRHYTNGFVPARALFNLQGANQQYIPFASPLFIGVNEQIKVETQNSSSTPELDGKYDIWFFCKEDNIQYSDTYLAKNTVPALKRIENLFPSELLSLPMNVNFTGTLNEELENVTTPADSEAMLLIGIASELRLAEMIITQLWNNQTWSSQRLPVWAFSGDTKASFLSSWLFPEPIFIPAQTTLSATIKNVGAENAGKITFIGCTP